MPKYIAIQVATPCHEKWEEMKPVSEGNHCGNCKKTVVDFTGMTDNQLMEYFQRHPSGVCGRFYSDQLGQALEIPRKKIPWLKYFVTVALPAMLIGYKAQAQKLMKKSKQPVMLVEKKASMPLLHLPPVVEGCVTGFNGLPVSFASVMVQGTMNGTSTDENGRFKIRTKPGDDSLVITCVGYQKKVIPITVGNHDVQLEIILAENVSLEALTVRCSRTVVAGGAMRIRLSGISSKPGKEIVVVPETAFTVYPNPAQRGGIITIRWKKPLLNDQQLVLINSSGSTVLEKAIALKQYSQEMKLALDCYAAGFYVIRVTDALTRKSASVSFIIQ